MREAHQRFEVIPMKLQQQRCKSKQKKKKKNTKQNS